VLTDQLANVHQTSESMKLYFIRQLKIVQSMKSYLFDQSQSMRIPIARKSGSYINIYALVAHYVGYEKTMKVA